MFRKCGVDNGVMGKPYLLYFDLIECIDSIVDCDTPKVCVEKCPTTSFMFNPNQCDSSNFNQTRYQLICQADVKIDRIQDCREIEERISSGDCARWYLESNTCKYFKSFFILKQSGMLSDVDVPILMIH